MQTQSASGGEQALAVGAHEVGHALTAQAVAMEPDPAIEGKAQSLPSAFELPDVRVY